MNETSTDTYKPVEIEANDPEAAVLAAKTLFIQRQLVHVARWVEDNAMRYDIRQLNNKGEVVCIIPTA